MLIGASKKHDSGKDASAPTRVSLSQHVHNEIRKGWERQRQHQLSLQEFKIENSVGSRSSRRHRRHHQQDDNPKVSSDAMTDPFDTVLRQESWVKKSMTASAGKPVILAHDGKEATTESLRAKTERNTEPKKHDGKVRRGKIPRVNSEDILIDKLGGKRLTFDDIDNNNQCNKCQVYCVCNETCKADQAEELEVQRAQVQLLPRKQASLFTPDVLNRAKAQEEASRHRQPGTHSDSSPRNAKEKPGLPKATKAQDIDPVTNMMDVYAFKNLVSSTTSADRGNKPRESEFTFLQADENGPQSGN